MKISHNLFPSKRIKQFYLRLTTIPNFKSNGKTEDAQALNKATSPEKSNVNSMV